MAQLIPTFFFLFAVSAAIRVWPLPSSSSGGSTTIVLSSNFSIDTDSASDLIKDALARYQALTFPRTSAQTSGSVLSSLFVHHVNLDETLQLATDESYKLMIPANGVATLSAATVYGCLRGLETFSQLVGFNFVGKRYEVAGGPWSIADAPRFAHRGVLMDTSRHYQPVAVLQRLIDSLAYAKFNVLHWHVCDSQSFPLEVCPSPQCREPLNPVHETTFQVIDGLFAQLTGRQENGGLFPDQFLHLGGDEVEYGCWDKSSEIVAWQRNHSLNNEGTYKYFVDRAGQIARQYGRTPVHWEEVFNHFGSKLDPNTIIHVWLDHATLKKIVSAGYRALLSNNDKWYLDYLARTWKDMYLNDPLEGITDPAQQRLVLGGEACMWAETVDPSDLFATVWPRAAAVAERLWSQSNPRDTAEAEPRLAWFRCSILGARGIGAAPVRNAQARSAPPEPGSCWTQ